MPSRVARNQVSLSRPGMASILMPKEGTAKAWITSLPIVCTREYIEDIRKSLPELPAATKARFEKDYGLSPYDAHTLTSSRELAAY